MITSYLNISYMFETPISYVMRFFVYDYTNIGQTIPLFFYASYDNVICNVM